ncbi:MAG: four helix bundle protein [Ignavibacteria bacterium]|nr:four helix bundle protein [Ignavibacteria bacterium]
MRNFRTLNIWQQGIEIVKEIYLLVEGLPKEEKYGLKSQMCRAAVSIPSNIAEGCSRNSEIEFKRFLEMSLGSAFELETQLLITQELKLILKEKVDNVLILLTKEQKMLNTLNTNYKNC